MSNFIDLAGLAEFKNKYDNKVGNILCCLGDASSTYLNTNAGIADATKVIINRYTMLRKFNVQMLYISFIYSIDGRVVIFTASGQDLHDNIIDADGISIDSDGIRKYHLSNQYAPYLTITFVNNSNEVVHNAGETYTDTLPDGVTEDEPFNIQTLTVGTWNNNTYKAQILTGINTTDRTLKRYQRITADNGANWSAWAAL